MRILHVAPFNTANVPLALVKAECSLGYDSRLVTFGPHQFDYEEDICLHLPFLTISETSILKKLSRSSSNVQSIPEVNGLHYYNPGWREKSFTSFREFLWSTKLRSAIKKYDLNNFDLYLFDGGLPFYRNAKVAKRWSREGKKIAALYLGSDLRRRGLIRDLDELSERNFTVEYDHINLYPGIVHLPFPFDFSKITRKTSGISEPLIIGHAPSNRAYKGTDFILSVLEELNSDYKFEIMLIENCSHEEALEHKSKCALFIDQISDIGYGINSIEAMAMGVPVLSSLMPAFKEIAPDNPFVEVDEQTLKSSLKRLLENRNDLQELGRSSEKWVKQFHDPVNVVKTIHKEFFPE